MNITFRIAVWLGARRVGVGWFSLQTPKRACLPPFWALSLICFLLPILGELRLDVLRQYRCRFGLCGVF